MFDVKIFIALNDVEELKKVKYFLISNGFDVVDQATNGTSAIRRILTLRPNLIIMDSNLQGMSGMEIAEVVQQNDIGPVIIVRAVGEGDIWLNSNNSIDIVFLQRPITKSALLQTVQLSIVNYQKTIKLKEEIRALKEKLEERKIVEKAKGILMKKYGITENEAHRKLQKQSMDKGIPLKEIAKAIILANEIE
ncbi:MAG TPA: ANTAR domain-containing protein [Clostridiaceae bacterium]|nr:ANTAR domain-containing protein [Clostridiaceae bacterium]